MRTSPAVVVFLCGHYPTMLITGEVKYSIDMNYNEPKEQAFRALRDCFQRGGKLLLCGNGGSAADCEHIVAELMKGMNRLRPVERWDYLQGALPAISLVSQTALTSAIANDIGAEWTFAQQVYGYGRAGDVLLGISTSGKSPNILRAMEVANCLNMQTIGLTGPQTYDFDQRANIIISCPGGNAAEIQEQHIKIYHELCSRLEEKFFP